VRFGSRGRGFGGPRRRFSRDFERDDTPKPVKTGEEYDVEISEIGAKGDGIARVNNFVIFVSGVKKGEKVRIKVTEVRNRFAIGEKVGAAKAAPAAEEASPVVVETEEPEASEELEETEEPKVEEAGLEEEAEESEESDELEETEEEPEE